MRAQQSLWCLATATATLALLSPPSVAQEEEPQNEQSLPRLFISDKLVLNVYSEPGQGGERVATIETGDAVDELERADAFVRVRLPDGREGWVGANYLTADPPAAVRLRELQREQKTAPPVVDKKSADEIAKLRKQNAALEGEVKALKASTAAPPAQTQRPLGETQSFDALEGEPAEARESALEDPGAGAVRIVIVAALAALIAAVAGFAAGYHALARRLRRKFGGLKIY
jgi:SH3 domain protein